MVFTPCYVGVYRCRSVVLILIICNNTFIVQKFNFYITKIIFYTLSLCFVSQVKNAKANDFFCSMQLIFICKNLQKICMTFCCHARANWSVSCLDTNTSLSISVHLFKMKNLSIKESCAPSGTVMNMFQLDLLTC